LRSDRNSTASDRQFKRLAKGKYPRKAREIDRTIPRYNKTTFTSINQVLSLSGQYIAYHSVPDIRHHCELLATKYSEELGIVSLPCFASVSVALRDKPLSESRTCKSS
jgi:hypothetical protein